MPNRPLADAVEAALAWHGDQTRKGKEVPYVAHLLGVASLVLEHGGSEVQAVAAVLHDVLEDTPATVADLEPFGDDVVAIVLACTDAPAGEDRGPGTSLARKQRYVEHFSSMAPAAALVSACDKLHNLGDLVRDASRGAFATSWPFNVSPAEQVAYQRSLIEAMADHPGVPADLVSEMRRLAARLEAELGLGA